MPSPCLARRNGDSCMSNAARPVRIGQILAVVVAGVAVALNFGIGVPTAVLATDWMRVAHPPEPTRVPTSYATPASFAIAAAQCEQVMDDLHARLQRVGWDADAF